MLFTFESLDPSDIPQGAFRRVFLSYFFSTLIFYVHALWLCHISEIIKHSLILFSSQGTLAALVNTEDEGFCILGRHTLNHFIASFWEWTYSPLKGQAISRLLNSVKLSLIKIQSHGWIPPLLWSWEWSPLPQWLYYIVLKQFCIKELCRWDFQVFNSGLTLQFLKADSKSTVLPNLQDFYLRCNKFSY